MEKKKLHSSAGDDLQLTVVFLLLLLLLFYLHYRGYLWCQFNLISKCGTIYHERQGAKCLVRQEIDADITMTEGLQGVQYEKLYNSVERKR